MDTDTYLIYFNVQFYIISFQLSCANYTFTLLPYKINDNGQCILTDTTGVRHSDDSSESKILLSCRIKKMLQEVEIQTKLVLHDFDLKILYQ